MTHSRPTLQPTVGQLSSTAACSRRPTPFGRCHVTAQDEAGIAAHVDRGRPGGSELGRIRLWEGLDRAKGLKGTAMHGRASITL